MTGALSLPLRRRRFRDVDELISALGGPTAVIAMYDWRFGLVVSTAVDSWADARGSTYGPAVSVTGTARPTVDTTGVVFDGSNDYLRADSASVLGAVTGSCALVSVTTVPAGGAANRNFVQLTAGSTEIVLASLVLPDGRLQGNIKIVGSPGAAVVNNPNDSLIHVVHARRSQSGGDATAGIRLDGGTEATGTGAIAAQTATRLTMAANRVDTPSAWGPFTLKAMLVIAGEYTGSATVNAWAQAVHGATA